MTRLELEDVVSRRDHCSGGREEGCDFCGLRHECKLDDAALCARTALHAYSALATLSGIVDEARRAGYDDQRQCALNRANLTVRSILREAEWEPEDA